MKCLFLMEFHEAVIPLCWLHVQVALLTLNQALLTSNILDRVNPNGAGLLDVALVRGADKG